MNTTLETRPGPPGHLAAGQGPGAGDDLLDDLGGGHVALQPALPGRAERAGHAAAGLRGDAHRDPVGVAHQHRLDQRAVEEPPQRLAGGAPVGLEGAQRRHQVGQQRGRPAAPRWAAGQVGHLRRVVDQPGEVVGGELPGPEARQSRLDHEVPALLGAEVGEVTRRLAAAARLVEDQGSVLGRSVSVGLVGLVGLGRTPRSRRILTGPGPNPCSASPVAGLPRTGPAEPRRAPDRRATVGRGEAGAVRAPGSAAAARSARWWPAASRAGPSGRRGRG